MSEAKDKMLRGGRGRRLAEWRLAQMGWAEGWPRITAKLLFQTYFGETSVWREVGWELCFLYVESQ